MLNPTLNETVQFWLQRQIGKYAGVIVHFVGEQTEMDSTQIENKSRCKSYMIDGCMNEEMNKIVM